MARILLVDDEPLLMESLEIILSIKGGHEIVGKAGNGIAALSILKEISLKEMSSDTTNEDRDPADIMLIDLNMPQMGGIELIREVRSLYPGIRMIVLTTFYDEKNIAEAIYGGATSYLLKDSGKDAILSAVDQAMTGRSVLDRKVMEKLSMMMNGGLAGTGNTGGNAGIGGNGGINGSSDTARTSGGSILDGKDLTEREKEICRLIAEGCTNSQIASMLFISEGTVKNYMSSIYDKFDVHDRAKLALMLKG